MIASGEIRDQSAKSKCIPENIRLHFLHFLRGCGELTIYSSQTIFCLFSDS